eukprot:SAG31_NODE_669_length_12945_cov_4.141912_3_plen_238_part_00
MRVCRLSQSLGGCDMPLCLRCGAALWLCALHHSAINTNVADLESASLQVAALGASALVGLPTLPLCAVEHGATAFHRRRYDGCGIGVGLDRHRHAVQRGRHVAIHAEARLHLEGRGRQARVTSAASLVAPAVVVRVGVPCGGHLALAIVLDDVHFHALRALVLLDITVGTAAHGRGGVKVRVHLRVCAGHVHYEGDVAAQQVERGLAVYTAGPRDSPAGGAVCGRGPLDGRAARCEV